MKGRLLSLLAMLMLGCGASDASFDEAASTTNRCLADEDCGASGLCYAGACYARKGDAYPLVLEVVLDPSAGPSEGASFLLPRFAGIDRNEPELSITVPPLARLEGRIDPSSDPTASCAKEGDASLASAHLTLTRTAGLIGLPKSKYALNAKLDEGVGSFDFGPVEIAGGTYDLYVETIGCAMAPLLSSAVRLHDEAARFDLVLPPATFLRGSVKPPEGVSLDGWLIDLVEPMRGRVISTVGSFVPEGEDMGFELAYRPVQILASESTENGLTYTIAGSAEASASPLLRIRPPQGLVAPTALWDLAAADLWDSGRVRLDMSGLSFTPVQLTGHVEGGANDHPLVTGAVVFSSLSLAGAEAGVTASFSVTVPTDERGAYSASLLPGQYRVVAIPDPALPWAITEANWQVSESPEHQAGRTLVVDAKPGLFGRARIAAFDLPLAGAVINAVAATPFNPNAVLDAALGKTPALPRASSRLTDADGLGSLELDPGLYDLSARPPDASWLPWFVQPRTLIPAPKQGARPITVDFQIPLPVLLGGRAYDAAGLPLSNALIRAYALLGSPDADDSTSMNGVVQVAETHTARDGRYKLLLPSKLSD